MCRTSSQVLHELHQSGCLLQPLQLNSDLRLIKTPAPPRGGTTAVQEADLSAPPQTSRHHPELHVKHPQQTGPGALPSDTTVSHTASCTSDVQQPAVANNAAAGSSIPQEVLGTLPGALTAHSCLAACQSGFSLVLRDMPKRQWAVGLLVQQLEAQLGLPAGANLYLTPTGM